MGQLVAARLCTVEGCDKPLQSKGRCAMHNWRMETHGSLDKPGRSSSDRFWEKVAISPGCWLWTGALTGHRYSQFWDGKRIVLGHRWAYENVVGPIPEGLTLDHLCRNPSCVNPAHLEPVDHRTNVLRGKAPSAMHARQTLCKRGHEFTLDRHGNRQCRVCINQRRRERRASKGA